MKMTEVDFDDFQLVANSGVYFLLDGDEVVYVGSSTDLQTRISSHWAELRRQTLAASNCMKFNAAKFKAMDGNEMLRAEREFIILYRPKYNRAHNPDYLIPKKAGSYVFRERGYSIFDLVDNSSLEKT